MSDLDDDFDFDVLKAAVKKAAPRPDPATRAAHLRLAQDNFTALQGARSDARPNPERPATGIRRGVSEMFARITGRGALTMTTALVACGVLVLSPAGQSLWRGGWQAGTVDPQEGPVAADATNGPSETVAPPDTPPTEAPPPEPVVDAPDTAMQPETANATAAETAVEQASQPDTDGRAETEAAPAQTAPDDLALAAPDAVAPLAEAEAGGLAPAAPDTTVVVPAAPALRQAAPSDGLASVGAVIGGALMDTDAYMQPEPDTEAFANAAENPLHVVAEEPVSTFSIDVDTASWSVVRQSLNWGQLPPPEAVRIEELINYFPYDYVAPGPDEAPFQPNITVMTTPWNADTQLVSIGIQGEMPAVADRPPLNLVFLIDTSGSMEDPYKLPLLKASFGLMIDELRPEDTVAIVTYAGSAGLVLQPTPASDRQAILRALQNLSAGGSTAGQAGLLQAYAVAQDMMEDGEVARVILATDGDFNVGISSTEELETYIADQRDTGVFLSVLGFGRGNLDDAIMQTLAQNGNGTAAYIDTLAEAQKVLVDQLTGALFPIASDVKIQVEWNPAVVAEYRLIGYETRALNREDFNNDRVDAGDLGAGHTVTAIYEITPVGSPAVMVDPLRYDNEAAPVSASDEIGFLRLRWKEPGADTSELMETPITEGGPVSDDAEFAAAIAGFGQLLRGSDHLGAWGWDQAIALAAENRGADPFGYRNEAVTLMRLAESLSQ